MGLGKSYTVLNTYFNTYLQDVPSKHMVSIHTFNTYWSLKYARGWVHWKQPGVCIEGYRVCLDGVEWPQYALTYALKGGCLDGICIEHMHCICIEPGYVLMTRFDLQYIPQYIWYVLKYVLTATLVFRCSTGIHMCNIIMLTLIFQHLVRTGKQTHPGGDISYINCT